MLLPTSQIFRFALVFALILPGITFRASAQDNSSDTPPEEASIEAQQNEAPTDISTVEPPTPTMLPTDPPTPTAMPTESTLTEDIVTETIISTPTSSQEFVTDEVESGVTPEVTATEVATQQAIQEFITEETRAEVTLEAADVRGPAGTDAKANRVEWNLLQLQYMLEQGAVAQAEAEAARSAVRVNGDGQNIYVEVIAESDDEAERLRPLIESLGGDFLIGYERQMEFYFPVMRLDELNALSGDFVVVQPREGAPRYGSITTEGVGVVGATSWHARGIDGTGVRIGIIDIGFAGYKTGETNGCVVAASNFIPYVTKIDDPLLGNHGANVAEIVCDMAPGADVYLAQAVTLSGVNAAIGWLVSQNVNIISMSLGFEDMGVGDGTGEMNAVIQKAIDAGVAVFVAAGNQNGSTWYATYNPTLFTIRSGTPSSFSPYTSNFHNFGGATSAVNRLLGGMNMQQAGCTSPFMGLKSTVLLRWSDWNDSRGGNANNQDYDLWIVVSNNNGATWYIYDGSLRNQTGLDYIPPNEYTSSILYCDGFPIFPSGTNPASIRYGVMIEGYSVDGAPETLNLIGYTPSGFELVSAGVSIGTPADSPDVIAVGAAQVKALSGFPFTPYPGLANYSSLGPVMGAGGSAPTFGADAKPEIAAPTHTKTSFDNTFGGTSAATPHASGFAALVYQANRAAYNALSGRDRVLALRDDLMNDFTRSDGLALSGYCATYPNYCYGAGVLELPGDYWFSWTENRLEENSSALIRSGANWQTVNSIPAASGSAYAYSTSKFAQVEFGTVYASSATVWYWKRPELSGNLTVSVNGVTVGVTGDTALHASIPTLTSFSVALTYGGTNLVRIQPNSSSTGLSLDYIQLAFPLTLQENDPALTLFGPWTRATASGASGGSHATTTTMGAGVGFYTSDDDFTLTYTGRPDGGALEVWVNGRRCDDCITPSFGSPSSELNTYNFQSKSSTMQQVALVHIPASEFGAAPYYVEIINTGRRFTGSKGTAFSLDNIRFGDGGGTIAPNATLEAEIGHFDGLTLGGVWTKVNTASAFGGSQWSTTTPGAEFRFVTTGMKNVVYTMNSSTGAILDIYVNGEKCAECGSIDTYAPATSYKVPHYFEIPGSYGAAPYFIRLKNSGTRHPSSKGTSMVLDRLASLDGAFAPLKLYDIDSALIHPSINSSPLFAVVPGAVMQLQSDGIGGEVHLFSTSGRLPVFDFFTTSRRLTLLLGIGAKGGRIWVEARSSSGGTWKRIAELNTNAASTLWRYPLDIRLPAADFPDSSNQVRVGVDTTTFAGSTNNIAYFDAVLVDDGGDLSAYPYVIQDDITFGSSSLLFTGPGWGAAPDQTNTYSGSERRTNQKGASVQFAVPDAGSVPYVVFSRQPDGGIAEVFVNGVKLREISLYAPAPIPQEMLALDLPTGLAYPAIVELRNTGKKTPGATNTYLYLDAVVKTGSATPFPVHPGTTGSAVQENNGVQLFGAAWTNTTSNAALTVDPYVNALAVTTANSGGVRFRLSGSNRFTMMSSVGANRGMVEVWINGRLCNACVSSQAGFVSYIDQFSPLIFWRVPHTVVIPTVTFGSGPYFVELRGTNMRSPSSKGTTMDVDAIVPLDGGTINWNSAYAVSNLGAPLYGNWSTIADVNSLNGSYLRTTTPSRALFFGFEPDANQNGWIDATTNGEQSYRLTVNPSAQGVILLRHMNSNGGLAEVWISDYEGSLPLQWNLCSECGAINSYSSYIRYQAPFFIPIPDWADAAPGEDIQILIVNTDTRPPASKGYELSIDGFIVVN